MRKFIPAIFISTVMLFCSVYSFAQDSAKPVQKVYAIYTTDTRGTFYLLENIESVDFQGIKCLKGKPSDIGWVKDTTAVYIPMDKILDILEYNSLQQYKDMVQKYNEKKLES
jgi:hypothetical protein